MKNFARCLVILFLMGVSSNLYAQEWIGYNQYIQTQPQIQTVYMQPQPVVIYQWVPYSVQQNVVVEQRRFFCVNQTVISRPVVQWVLQPVVIYR
jgi:hypothetical protein